MTKQPLTIDPKKFDQLSNPTEDMLSQVRKIYQGNKNENERRIALQTWIAVFLTNVDTPLADTATLCTFITNNFKFIDEECQKLVDKAIVL